MPETKLYRKKEFQPMRPYVEGEDMSAISVSANDTPEVGGMIAINPHCPTDMWYINPDFFLAHYEEVK